MARLLETMEHQLFRAKVYKDTEWDEYIVKFEEKRNLSSTWHRGNGVPTWHLIKDGDYHTDDKLDAVQTGKAVIRDMYQNVMEELDAQMGDATP